MNLQAMLDHQRELDKMFTDGKNISKTEILNDSILALMVETAEFANEVQSFKHWKNKKIINEEAAGEELIDVLFFYLSICNQLGYSSKDLEKLYMKKYEKNLNRIKDGY